MAVGSNVNPNYPIPGIDQSSKGFRDNFSTIKVELENLQSKNIVLTGDATGNAVISSGSGEVVINTTVAVANAASVGENFSVQYNRNGKLGGDGNLLYDYSTQTLIVDVPSPDTTYSLDSGRARIHNFLAVQADAGNAVLNIAGGDATYPTVQLISTNNSGVGQANLNVSNVDAVTIDTLNIQFNSHNIAQFNASGMSLGAVHLANPGGPVGYFEVYADARQDVANFYSILEYSDNDVRFSTAAYDSTMGLVLENTGSDSVAGIRIGRTGNLSLHTGGFAGSNLSDSTITVLIDRSGRMGIGIPTPQQRLDVDGGIQWNLPNTANVAPVISGQVGVAIDSWNIGQYRSADYTVQVTDSVGLIEITKLLVMHENGFAYQTIYANINDTSGSPGPTILGTFVASISGSTMQLIYEAVTNNTTVKVDATYIPL
jgi:hypothetical protein